MLYYCPLWRGVGFAADHLTMISPLFNHFPLIFTSTCLNPFRFYFCQALFWSWQGRSSLWIPNHATCTWFSLSLPPPLFLTPSLHMHGSWFYCLKWQIRSLSIESRMRKTCFEPETNLQHGYLMLASENMVSFGLFLHCS